MTRSPDIWHRVCTRDRDWSNARSEGGDRRGHPGESEGDLRPPRTRSPSHASGAWTMGQARSCHALGEPAMATLKSVAQRWVPPWVLPAVRRGLRRQLWAVRSKRGAKTREPASWGRPAPRLGVSTSIPSGSRKGTRARLTRLGQIGGALNLQVEPPVVALHGVARRVLEVEGPEQREAQLPTDRVRRRVVDRREGVQVTMLPV